MKKLECKFVALEVSLELAEVLGPTLMSVALNLAEGSRSQGGNRRRAFWIASGSLEELLAALRVAMTFGEIEIETAAKAEPLIDRLRGLMWGRTHPAFNGGVGDRRSEIGNGGR
jgi:hypothetical protein